MNIEEKIKEEKRKKAVISDTEVDLKHIFGFIPQIVNFARNPTPEFHQVCQETINACDRIIQTMTELKAQVPTVEKNTEQEAGVTPQQ